MKQFRLDGTSGDLWSNLLLKTGSALTSHQVAEGWKIFPYTELVQINAKPLSVIPSPLAYFLLRKVIQPFLLKAVILQKGAFPPCLESSIIKWQDAQKVFNLWVPPKTINFLMRSSKGAKSKCIQRFRHRICKWVKHAFDNVCSRDATLFERVANHGLLTAEPKNYAIFHSSGETSIICSVVLVNWSSKYNILLLFLLFLEGLFHLLWYSVVISVDCFCT